MTDLETAIMIKNMARETVRRMTAAVKNAALTVKRDFTWPRSFASGPASIREVKIKAGAPVEKKNGEYFVAPSYFSGDSLLKHDATYYGCRVAKDNIDGLGVARNATGKNAALREVAVTYSDGTTITTSMAAHLSDADIKNYFRVGREFNIGSGAKDKMVKVKSVKILNATAKNADEPKFNGEGFLLDKNGKPFFVYNGTTADLIIRKYKMMGINLTAIKDRTGDVYFKKA